MSYAFPKGGLPSQNQWPESHAVFTESYAVIPQSCQTDIVTSLLPGWVGAKVWILARPMTGFAETFAQYAVELAPEGGSADPEPERDAQAAIFVAKGTAELKMGADSYTLTAGTFAYVPAGLRWSIWNRGDEACGFHWIRKHYDVVEAEFQLAPVVVHESDVPQNPMPGCEGLWMTQRFLDPLNLAYDMHVNVVTFENGGRIPFAETHVMEHGLYVLEGHGKYLLNKDWVDVGPGDFMWLRAFCPQACIAEGDGPFRYLLYKDVNRHPKLTLP
ncbi:MAG: bifunctional allantoicase/(S)-ureidoglycine aminohydrolase [Pseudomonadota bacterium]